MRLYLWQICLLAVVGSLNYASSERIKRDALIELHKRWPGGVMPYKISPDAEPWTDDEMTELESSMEFLERYSCLEFRPATPSDAHWVTFYDGEQCSSALGFGGDGEHFTSLPKGCRRLSIIVHELLHRLGVYHEEDRFDRQRYMDRDATSEVKASDHYGISFDPVSCMFGGAYVSFKDFYLVNQMYQCPSWPLQACPPGGFVGKDCQCWCDSGIRKWPIRHCSDAVLPVTPEARTVGGNAGGAPCIFPFIYQGVERHECTNINHNTFWCGTTPDYDTDRMWGDCQVVPTSGGNSNGAPCHFPFKYRDQTYASCTMRSRFTPWCSTTSDFDRDGQKTACSQKTTKGKRCVFPFIYKGETYYTCQHGQKPWCCTESECDDNSNWDYCEDQFEATDPNGPSCVFPYKYRSELYNSCTLQSPEEFWCATTADYDADGLWGLCPDVNECEDGNNGGCDHFCWNNVRSYECSCKPGYNLNSDGKTCRPAGVFGGKNDVDGATCFFPFQYGSSTYQEATTTALYGARYSEMLEPWCMTSSGSDALWAEVIENECEKSDYFGCDHICRDWHGVKSCGCYPGYVLSPNGKTCVVYGATEGGSAGGAACRFPFTHESKSYNWCKYDDNDKKYWCRTTSDSSSGAPWGYCPEYFRMQPTF